MLYYYYPRTFIYIYISNDWQKYEKSNHDVYMLLHDSLTMIRVQKARKRGEQSGGERAREDLLSGLLGGFLAPRLPRSIYLGGCYSLYDFDAKGDWEVSAFFSPTKHSHPPDQCMLRSQNRKGQLHKLEGDV